MQGFVAGLKLQIAGKFEMGNLFFALVYPRSRNVSGLLWQYLL